MSAGRQPAISMRTARACRPRPARLTLAPCTYGGVSAPGSLGFLIIGSTSKERDRDFRNRDRLVPDQLDLCWVHSFVAEYRVETDHSLLRHLSVHPLIFKRLILRQFLDRLEDASPHGVAAQVASLQHGIGARAQLLLMATTDDGDWLARLNHELPEPAAVAT